MSRRAEANTYKEWFEENPAPDLQARWPAARKMEVALGRFRRVYQEQA
jgi:hypothetical protein